MKCDCGHEPGEHSEHTTGYGKDNAGKTMCYACCAETDKKSMRETGKAVLYLVKRADGSHELTNWPGSLCLYVLHMKVGSHNIAGTRYDVWFIFGGRKWHGVQYGDNTQICHCRRLEKKTNMLTAQQIEWASAHDWFVSDNNDGTITVEDISDDGAGNASYRQIVWRKSFAALRAWAGY